MYHFQVLRVAPNDSLIIILIIIEHFSIIHIADKINTFKKCATLALMQHPLTLCPGHSTVLLITHHR